MDNEWQDTGYASTLHLQLLLLRISQVEGDRWTYSILTVEGRAAQADASLPDVRQAKAAAMNAATKLLTEDMTALAVARGKQ